MKYIKNRKSFLLKESKSKINESKPQKGNLRKGNDVLVTKNGKNAVITKTSNKGPKGEKIEHSFHSWITLKYEDGSTETIYYKGVEDKSLKYLYKSDVKKSKSVNEVNVNDEDFGEDKKDEVKYSKGVIMLKLERNEEWNKILESIADEDVYESEEEPGRFGVESDPHVTVLYGTLDDKIDLEEMKEVILNRDPINLKLVDISMFENDDFDVLKFGIESEDLNKFNSDIREKFEYENDYDDYVPHATIAYLKSGTGKKYIKDFEEEGQIELEGLNEITYSRVIDEEKEKIKLTIPLPEETEEDKTEESNENISDFLANSDVPEISEGDKVDVEMKLMVGSPVVNVTAKNDSWINDGVEMFSFLQMGDMMMIAKKKGNVWISE